MMYKVGHTFLLNTLCIVEDTFKRWTFNNIKTSSENNINNVPYNIM